MADVGVSLRAHLVGQSAITDLISTRIWCDVFPQAATFPAVIYRQISAVHDHKIDGLAGAVESRITYEALATTRTVSRSIIDAIISELDGLRGTYTGVDILSITVDAGPEHYTEPPEDRTDNHRYITTIDFLVYHRE